MSMQPRVLEAAIQGIDEPVHGAQVEAFHGLEPLHDDPAPDLAQVVIHASTEAVIACENLVSCRGLDMELSYPPKIGQ